MPPESATAAVLPAALQESGLAWPTFQPPEASHPTYGDWARLRDESRDSVKAALSVCEQVWLQLRAGKRLTTAAKSVARMMGWASKAAWKKPARLWEQYEAAAFSWKAVLNKRHEPDWWNTLEENIILPEGVKEHFKKLSEKCGDCKTAYELFLGHIDAWRRGRGPAIAGWDTPPPNAAGKRHPAGCSYANLMRHGSRQEELDAARDGREAALKHFPAVRTTRAGSYVCAEVQFDDFWHNNAVRATSTRNSGVRRVLEFGAIDHYSGYLFRSGLKVRMPDETEERMKQLSEVDFRMYVAAYLTTVGYHPLGTILNVEHGTAAIRAELEAIILRLTGGKVTIKRSGMLGRAALPGQFEGRSKGSYRAKALKEGMGKLVHNRLSHLPGNVGTNFMAMPAKHHGEAKHDEFLMQLGIIFPELAQDLSYAMVNSVKFQKAVHDVQDQINRRPDHNLEGWDEDDLWAREFTLDPNAAVPVWQPFSALANLAADKRAAVDAILASDVRCIRRRRLSPLEVFDAAKGQLIRLPFSALPELVGRDLGLKKMVERKCFEIGGQFFLAEIKDKAGFPRQLENGEIYLVFLNPFVRERLIVCDEKTMAYLGECKPWNIPKRAEAEAIHEATGQRERLFKDAVADLTVRSGLGSGENHAANAKAIRAHAKKIHDGRGQPDREAFQRRQQRSAARENGDLRELVEKKSAPITSGAFQGLVKVEPGSPEHLGKKHPPAATPKPQVEAALRDADDGDLRELLNKNEPDPMDENIPF